MSGLFINIAFYKILVSPTAQTQTAIGTDKRETNMSMIEIYTRPGCGYCSHAKRLLASKGLAFIEYDVYEQPEHLNDMRRRTLGRSYPQVFINGCSVGGFEELLELEQHKKLPKSNSYTV
jgi:glutaredoxin 3